MDYPPRACPGCGATALAQRGRISSRPAAENCAFDDLRAGWRGFFRDQKFFFSYHRCSVCRQLYCPRYFTPRQLDQLYGQMEDNTAGLNEALLLRTQRGYWDILARFAPLPPGDYLELGPDIGLFTRAATTSSALKSFWLVEPNVSVHPALQEVLKEKPYTLLNDHARIAKIPDRTLSLAVAIHVLDHLLEPQPLLDLLVRKLRPGGCLLAVTHNERSLAARGFSGRWPAYCLQHPQLYAPHTLRQSYERAGLQQVQIRRTINHFPIAYLLQHGLFAAGLGKISVPLPEGWVAGLKLGNIAALGRKG